MTPTAGEKRRIKEEQRKKKFDKQINILLINYFKYVILFFFLLNIIIGYVFVVEPKYQRTKDNIKTNYIKQQQLYSEQKQNLDNLKKLIYIYESINPEIINKVESVLPKQYIKEQLFSDIDFLLTKNGYLVSSVEIGGGEKSANTYSRFQQEESKKTFSGDIGSMTISLNVGGVDYFGLKSLLEILESSLKIMDVNSINFNPSSRSAILKITTYYLKD